MRPSGEIQILGPDRQRDWRWPAVINFTLGGAGAGFYILAALGGDAPRGWLAPLLVVAGLAAVALEAGRPLRAHHLLRNLGRSWMSREVFAALMFVVAGLLDSYRPSLALSVVAVTSAAALLLCQGFIVYRAGALPAWNVPVMPVLFISSGLAAGAGVALLAWPHATAGIGLACIGANLVAWLVYLWGTRERAFRQATRVLRRPGALIVVVGLGHVLPGILLGLALARTGSTGAALVAGAAMIVGSLSQKAGVVLWAGYLQAIALRLPVGVKLGVKVDALPVAVAVEKSL